jgi:hypothetical protein
MTVRHRTGSGWALFLIITAEGYRMALAATRERIGIIGELWAFMKVRKKWWLGPILLMLGLLAILIVFTGSVGALGPFIYPLI